MQEEQNNMQNGDNDEMEEVLLDVKAGIEFLKNEDGKEAQPTMPYLPRGQIKKIVLIGASGGGPTMSFYQAEAENNQVRHLPSGEAFDLSGLPRADGLVTLSSHRGRALVLTAEMDASLTDENDIYSIDSSLDLYNPDNGFKDYQKGESSNYSHDFLVRYRKEQNARNDRLTQRALALIKEAKEERERIEEYTGCTMQKSIDVPFFSHRTSGDPRFFDMSLDPSDRLIGSGMGDALTVKYSPTAFKRVNTARNWLSMCSRTMSNAATEPNIARITVPALIFWATADRLIYRQDTEDIFQSCQGQSLPPERQNKTLVHVPGLTHGFSPIAPEYAEMTSRTMEKIIDWTRSCVEKGCSVGVRRVKLLVGGGEEPLGPPEVTDPLSREVPVLPAKKRPCPSIYHE